MRHKTHGWIVLISCLIAMGCSLGNEPSAASCSVSGRVHFPENFVMPSDAIAALTLTDVSPSQDSSGAMLARQTLEPPYEPSMPFCLVVKADRVSDRALYTVQARVASASRVILANAATHPVLTQGNPTVVDVYVTSRDRYSTKPLGSR